MLAQCSSDHGPQLAAALTGTGNDASRDKAIQQLTVIVENVFFELTEILVYRCSLQNTRTPFTATIPLRRQIEIAQRQIGQKDEQITCKL